MVMRMVAEAHTKLQAGKIATELHFFISILGSNIALDIKLREESKRGGWSTRSSRFLHNVYFY
jgi:hypothetical protein